MRALHLKNLCRVGIIYTKRHEGRSYFYGTNEEWQVQFVYDGEGDN